MSESYPTYELLDEELDKLPKHAQRDPWIWRYAIAYLRIAAEAKYRPCAPSDGFGNIQLDDTAYKSRDQVKREAFLFGIRCVQEETYGCAPTTVAWRGVVNGHTGVAGRFALEAAKAFNGGGDFDPLGIKLLRMALAEAERKCIAEPKGKMDSIENEVREEWVEKALKA